MLDKQIPLVDLKRQSRMLKMDVLQAIEDVIDSAGYILGKEVELFEEEFAAYCGSRFAVGVANGTDALHLALRALTIGPGDEVITAGNSFAATALAIAYAGAEPVFVDADETDFTIDVNCLEHAITEKTKAIIPVHLYGQPAKMGDIRELADRHGIAVLEDSAQAHGAELAGQRMGTFGQLGCYSFYPGKNLGAFGDGGAIVTNDGDLARQLKLLRNYGQIRKNEHAMLGFNCRLDSIQAAILLVKLPHLERWTEARRDAAQAYHAQLRDSEFQLPEERSEVRHVYHLYVVRHPERDRVIAELAAQGISCGVHYPHPLHRATPFQNSRTVPTDLPICSRLAGEIMSLPMYPELTVEQIARVSDCLRGCMASTQ